MEIVSVVVERAADYQIKVYHENFIESGTVTVTSEDTAFPKYRLYDRAQGLLFKGTSHPNPFNIKIDLGASGPYPAIDAVILGAGHNLTGLALTLAYSDDDGTYTTAITWTCVDGINRQSFTGIQHRYWKLSIASPAANPEIGELFLTKVHAFDRNPNWQYAYGDDKNVSRVVTTSGMVQKTKLGLKKKGRSYKLTNIGDEQKEDLEAFDLATDGYENFYIEDLEGNLFFAELTAGLPRFTAEKAGRWGVDMEVLEVLD